MASVPTTSRGRLVKGLVVVSTVVGVLVLGAVVIVLLIMWSYAPPSDKALSKRFQRHRPELETLVRMLQEDGNLSRVADEFTCLKDDRDWPRPESKWGITRRRWDEYRRLFRKVGLIEGLEKDQAGNVYFIFHSEGLVTHGASKGLVYCTNRGDPDAA